MSDERIQFGSSQRPAPFAGSLDDWSFRGSSWQHDDEAAAARRTEAEQRRVVVRESVPRRELTIDGLLAAFGMSREYAEHLVQSYCTCDVDRFRGVELCPHAKDEGVSW